MKPSPAGEGKYRLAEFAPGGSDAFQSGFQIFRVKHHQRSAPAAVRMQRGTVEPTVHATVIEGAVAVAVVLKGPAKHIAVKRLGLTEVFRGQLDIIDPGVFFHDRTTFGRRSLP